MNCLKKITEYCQANRSRRKGVFYNTFIHALCVLLCVAFVFALLLYHSSVQALRKNLQETNVHALEQIVSVTDTIFSGLYQDIEHLVRNSNVVNTLVLPGVERTERNFNTVSTLQDFEESSLYIKSVALLTNYDSMVYTPYEEAVPLTQFELAPLFFGEAAAGTGLMDMEIFRYGDSVILRKNLINGYQGYLGTLLICLDGPLLAKNICGQQNIIIATKAGERLWDNTDAAEIPSVERFSALDHKNIRFSDAANGTWLLASHSINDLCFYYYYERPSFGHMVLLEKPRMLWLIPMIFILLVIMALSFAWVYYRPIKKLLRKASVSGEITTETNQDEWTLLGEAFGFMSDQSAHFKNLATTVAPDIQKRLLIDLIEGRKILEDNICLTLSGIESPILMNGLSVVFTLLSGTAMIMDPPTLQEYTNRINAIHTKSFFAIAFSYHASIVVLVQFYEPSYATREGVLEEICHVLQTYVDNNERLYIGHSDVFQGLHNLSMAYPIAYSRAIKPQIPAEGALPILAADIQDVVSTLTTGPQGTMDLMVSRLVQQIYHGNLDKEEIFLNTRVLVEELNKLVGAYYLEIEPWIAFQEDMTVESLESAVLEYAATVITGLQEIMEKRQNKYLIAAMEYVDTHYSNAELSVAVVAENIGIHSSYLSKLFNSAYHMGFPQYISEVRLAKAKQLLKEDDLLIRDISAQVGFLSVQTFMRVFKRQMGCTPREYRQAMQHPEQGQNQ